MASHLLVCPLDSRLVAARRRHAALELIGHDGAQDTAEGFEGPDVAAYPVRDRLRARRLRVGEVGCAEDCDEELDLRPLAGHGIDDARLVAGVVDEELLAGS